MLSQSVGCGLPGITEIKVNITSCQCIKCKKKERKKSHITKIEVIYIFLLPIKKYSHDVHIGCVKTNYIFYRKGERK